MHFDSYIYAFSKKEYIKRDKINECCPLCSIYSECHASEGKGKSLIVFYSDKVVCCVNLFPYNNGHIMLYPIRHIEDPREFAADELEQMNYFLFQMLDVLDEVYRPSGYNIGYNIGSFAGASLPHIHQHIIPRFPNELGMIDLIGGAKVIIEDPKDTLLKLKQIAVKKRFKFDVKIPK